MRQRIAEMETSETHRKQVEVALRESEEKHRIIMESVHDVVFQLSPSGYIQYVSPKVEEVYGYKPEDLIGKHLKKTTPLGELPKALAALKSALSGKLIRNLEINQLDSKGKIVHMEITGTPVKKKGKIIAVQGVMRNITERKRAEEALKERKKELEIKTSNLEEVNAALKVLLKKRDEDKTELEEKVLFNMKELVMPYLEKLNKSGLDERQKAYFSILQSNLTDIISPFSRWMSTKYLNLTPREIQVANLVRQGKTSKEIADLLNVSIRTIEAYRDSIRKKIGIKHKKANLRTYLLSIQ